MSNYQDQTPTGESKKMTEIRAKQKTKTIIKATTRATAIMGGVENGFVILHIESKFLRWRFKHQGSPGVAFQ